MKTFVIVLLFALMTSGCKETHCPAFPNYLIDYFPYTEGDKLKFANSDDTLKLVINNNWSSDSYSFGWNCKCACEANSGFNTELNEEFRLSIEGQVNLYNENNRSELSIDFYNANNSVDNFNIVIENLDPFHEENKLIFGDTLIFINEINNQARVTGMRLVKGKGIINIFDTQENCNWLLIDE